MSILPQWKKFSRRKKVSEYVKWKKPDTKASYLTTPFIWNSKKGKPTVTESRKAAGSEKVKWSKVAQSCPTLWDLLDGSLPGSSVHGIFQAKILEWAAISFSRGSSQHRDRTQISCIADRHFAIWATREALVWWNIITKLMINHLKCIEISNHYVV